MSPTEQTSCRFEAQDQEGVGGRTYPNSQTQSGAEASKQVIGSFFGDPSENPPPISHFYPRDLNHVGAKGSPVQESAGGLLRCFAPVSDSVLQSVLLFHKWKV